MKGEITMLDKKGVEIRTGQVVKVTGAFFKNDNGLYFVDHSPGDPSWSGSDYSLKKVCRSFRLPVIAYLPSTTDRQRQCRAHSALLHER